MKSPKNLVAKRPAETAGIVAGAVAYLIGRLFDLNGEDVYALSILVGFVPAAVTWAVELAKREV
jgi:hypothetical protein